MPCQKLTPKQARFVEEYLIDLNATQAAIRAGYSEKTASRIGPELLGKTCVSEAIQKAREARSKKLNRQAYDVVKDIYELGKEARQQGEYGIALKALELEGKHLGIFTPKQDLNEPTTITVTFANPVA